MIKKIKVISITKTNLADREQKQEKYPCVYGFLYLLYLLL